MIRATAGALAAALVFSALPAAAQDDMITRVNRARGFLIATATEQAVDSLRAINNDLANSSDLQRRAEVLTLLAKAELSLGDGTAAADRFQTLARLDPFHSFDSTAHNPDVVNLYAGARASIAVIGLRMPQDTTINPENENLNVTVGVGKAGGVTFRFVPMAPGGPQHTVQLGVTSTTTVAVTLLLTDSTALPAGDYRFDALFRATDNTSDSTSMVVTIARLPVDTTALLPDVDPVDFLPETRKGGYVLTSVIQGVLVGVAAGAIPAFVANRDLNDPKIPTESIGVGLGIGAAGLLGAVLGRGDVTIQENVDHNIGLINARVRENGDITVANARLRALAPIRLTVRQP